MIFYRVNTPRYPVRHRNKLREMSTTKIATDEKSTMFIPKWDIIGKRKLDISISLLRDMMRRGYDNNLCPIYPDIYYKEYTTLLYTHVDRAKTALYNAVAEEDWDAIYALIDGTLYIGHRDVFERYQKQRLPSVDIVNPNVSYNQVCEAGYELMDEYHRLLRMRKDSLWLPDDDRLFALHKEVDLMVRTLQFHCCRTDTVHEVITALPEDIVGYILCMI
jgi:hypothetical protein